MLEILQRKFPPLSGLIPLKSRISFPKLPIRNEGIQHLLFTLAQIRLAVISGICRKDLAFEIVLAVAESFQILFGSINYGRQMLMILTAPKSLTM